MKKRFYYADGKKVELNPSEKVVAVRFKKDTDEKACSDVIDSTSGIKNHEDASTIEALDFVLVDVVSESENDVQSIDKNLNKSQEVSTTLPVFKALDGNEDDFLVATTQFLVQFHPSVSKEEIGKINQQNKVIVVAEDHIGPNSYLLAVSEGSKTDAIDMANKYYEMEEVSHAEPEFAFPLEQLAAPPVNDVLFGKQWALEKMNVPAAWKITKGRSNIKIAILDEGVDIYHPDLRNKIVTPYDAVDNDNNQNPNPWDNHGTACAGIAAAQTNNRIGIAGVAANCKIMPIRIASSRRGSSRWITSSVIIARGIYQARLRGADVLSNSWGGGPYSDTIRSQFRDAKNLGRGGKGCVIICATGNTDAEGVSYPAKYPECMACGASNQWDKRKSETSADGEYWWGSSYGPEVDFVAPGVQIYTTDNRGSAARPGDYIHNFNGTSSATPNAAGVAALILSVDPSLKEWEVGDILKLTAKDISPGGKDIYTGWGRIDAFKATKAAQKLCFSQKMTLAFLGKNKDCYMRFHALRLSNCGICTVRLNSFKIKSFDSRGRVIDTFEYHGNPGGIMLPGVSTSGGSGHSQLFSDVLLKAVGNKSRWSYSWNASWNYTFWRPSNQLTSSGAPVMIPTNFTVEIPLSAEYEDVDGQENGEGDSNELFENEFSLDPSFIGDYLDSPISQNGNQISENGMTISKDGDRSITIKF